jgi:hypothetical protein
MNDLPNSFEVLFSVRCSSPQATKNVLKSTFSLPYIYSMPAPAEPPRVDVVGV